MKKGLVGLAFGILPDRKPGISNERIALILDVVPESPPFKKHSWLIYTDQEIAEAMKKKPHFITSGHPFAEVYRDTEASVSEIVGEMKKDGIKECLVVAHLFLHRLHARRLLEKHGIHAEVIGLWRNPSYWWIPFCKGSAQWWTKDPFGALLYTVLRVLTGRKGK